MLILQYLWEHPGIIAFAFLVGIVVWSCVDIRRESKGQPLIIKESDSQRYDYKTHLPHLQEIIKQLRQCSEQLAEEAANYPLEDYKRDYIQIQPSGFIPSTKMILLELAEKGFLTDNLYLLKLKDQDDKWNLLLTEFDELYSEHIFDEDLRRYVKEYLKAINVADSLETYSKLLKKHLDILPDEIPEIREQYRQDKKRRDMLSDLKWRISKRIHELLEGRNDGR